MNKTELIDQIATAADISKAAAGRALDAAVDAIKGALKEGDSVNLIGFGTFYVGERAARTGRITSYNVCYTKLLRTAASSARPAAALEMSAAVAI